MSHGETIVQRLETVGSSPAATTDATSTSDGTPLGDRTRPRTANGSRTPWDGGDYLLPLSFGTKNLSGPSRSPEIYGGDSILPGNPENHIHSSHKTPDSRSSSSSTRTASSVTPISHSRIPSHSTVSKYHPLSALIDIFFSLDCDTPERPAARQPPPNGVAQQLVASENKKSHQTSQPNPICSLKSNSYLRSPPISFWSDSDPKG